MDSEKLQDVKFGLQFPPYPWDFALDTALYAEKAGFDSASGPDHAVYYPAPLDCLEIWTTLSAIAAKTERIKLAPLVTEIHRHHPAVLAHLGGTLDVISNGRLILGIGAGEAMNLEPYGIDWKKKRVSKMVEAIKVMKKLWTEAPEPVNFDGEFYKLRKAAILRPVQRPHPPIWVGGWGPRMMRIIGEVADGWAAIDIPPEIYEKRLKVIKEHAKRCGRDPEKITPALMVYSSVADDPDVAKERIALRVPVEFITLPFIPEEMGYKVPEEIRKMRYDEIAYFTAEIAEKAEEAAKEVPWEMAEKIFLIGTPDDCIGKLEKWVKSGVRWFIIRMWIELPLVKEATQLFAQKVLPYFRKK